MSNLPYDATSTDLQTAFSDLAPVRSAFVVLEHGTAVSKGVGYVTFSIKEDAQMAFDSITANGMAINGRKLRVQWAESKVIPHRIFCLCNSSLLSQPRSESVKKEKEKVAPISRLPAHKTNDPLAIRTIVVSGLPSSITQKTLWKKLRKLEGAEDVEWPAKTVGGDDPCTGMFLFPSIVWGRLYAGPSACIVLII